MRPLKYNIEEYVGQKFGHLTLVSAEPHINEKRERRHKCQCDCGNICYRLISDLIHYKSTTCSVNCKYHSKNKYSQWEVKEFDTDGNLIATHESIRQIANSHRTSTIEVEAWITEKRVINGSVFHCDELEAERPKRKLAVAPKKRTNEKRIEEGDYTAVPYEQKYGVVCITPCPYYEAPKPMVGSSRCHECSSYISQNRETRHVYCKIRLNHKKP